MPLLDSIQLVNFLSYGPRSEPLPLGPLNVLIGPNGSGKSNLVEALALLSAVPGELPKPIREGGGVREWLWRGTPPAESARIEVALGAGNVTVGGKPHGALRYRLEFTAQGDVFQIADERLENRDAAPGAAKPFFFFGYEHGHPMLSVVGQPNRRTLAKEDVDPSLSILAQRKDPDSYPEITRVGELFARIRVYRQWSFGPDAPTRLSCSADVRTDRLEPRLDNLPARLATLKRDQHVKKALLEALKELSGTFTDLEIVPEGGRLRLFLVEPQREVPAARLSDGTLRYLALLAILLDPAPPPLVVIEEPELGLHPDALPVVARLLSDASERCQIVVTTHSETLVSAFTEAPESVIVFDAPADGSSVPKRLSKADLEPWLQRYRLGDYWLRGGIGGTRW